VFWAVAWKPIYYYSYVFIFGSGKNRDSSSDKVLQKKFMLTLITYQGILLLHMQMLPSGELSLNLFGRS
jgi:hypothetical protein